MSSDYDEYAKLEARKSNIAAGRHPDAPSGSVAFSDSRGHQPLIHEPKKNPVVYTDENGQKFTIFAGKRDYFDEDDL